jgi:hypothetical protein
MEAYMPITPPSGNLNPYPRRKNGYSGALGKGANVEIRFLQTAISREELDSIDLIENIPGGEKWDVKDLFQRAVDKDRVGKSILPYLQNDELVKFFNPLTLVLLPFDSTMAAVEKELEFVPAKVEVIDGHSYQVFEKEGYYKLNIHNTEPAFSSIEWNEHKVKVVAIDGQHRLAALKRWKSDPVRGQELASWSIPVVILALYKEGKEVETPNILEVVRKTFIYINSTAEGINESRRILLDDESVNCICTQEVIQCAHTNDQNELIENVDSTKVPLMFYDWRGEVIGNRPNPGAASVIEVKEVEQWFANYIFSEDGSSDQEKALNLEDMVPPLRSFGVNQKLNHEDAERVRVQFRKHFLPAYSFLMENFKPYRNYIIECRQLQYREHNEDDLARFAFQKIFFGTHRAGPELFTAIENKYQEIVEGFTIIKSNSFHELLSRDIGMRGVWSAFGALKPLKDSFETRTVDWLEYSKWFTDNLNSVYENGWFHSWSALGKDQKRFLTHIAYDPSGQIINYKYKDVSYAFGAVMALLIAKSVSSVEFMENVWSEMSTNLRSPLKKGIRKLVRAELAIDYSGTPTQFAKDVNEKTDKDVDKWIKSFRKYLDT